MVSGGTVALHGAGSRVPVPQGHGSCGAGWLARHQCAGAASLLARLSAGVLACGTSRVHPAWPETVTSSVPAQHQVPPGPLWLGTYRPATCLQIIKDLGGFLPASLYKRDLPALSSITELSGFSQPTKHVINPPNDWFSFCLYKSNLENVYSSIVPHTEA